jgi:hypothetical protein
MLKLKLKVKEVALGHKVQHCFKDGHLWVELIMILITKASNNQSFQFELWNNSHCIAQRMAHVKKHVTLNR